jgi:hypothetical protein
VRENLLSDALAHFRKSIHRKGGAVDVQYRGERGVGVGVARTWFSELADAIAAASRRCGCDGPLVS